MGTSSPLVQPWWIDWRLSQVMTCYESAQDKGNAIATAKFRKAKLAVYKDRFEATCGCEVHKAEGRCRITRSRFGSADDFGGQA